MADIFMIVLGLMVRALPAIMGSVVYFAHAGQIQGIHDVANVRTVPSKRGDQNKSTAFRLFLRILASARFTCKQWLLAWEDNTLLHCFAMATCNTV